MFKSLNKNISRLLAVLLAFALCFGFAPAVFAMEGAEETPGIPEENIEVPEEVENLPKITSGTCGADLSWNFSAGTLTISGSGAMTDFRESEMAPWYALRYEILAVVLPEGLTSIGDLAFYQCTAIKSISIPNSVTKIGWYAFDGCKGITMLSLGNGVRTIEEAAFRGCSSLKALRIPNSVTSIGFQAFSWCESITEVKVPASVAELGYAVFAFCHNLIRAEILAQIDTLPDWTFYGCTSLAEIVLPPTVESAGEYAFYDCDALYSVVHEGDDEAKEQIREDIERDTGSGLVDISDSSGSEEDGSFSAVVEEEDGSLVSKEGSSSENSTIVSEETIFVPEGEESSGNGEVHVDVTLENGQGWDDVLDFIEKSGDSDSTVYLDVYVKDDSEVPEEILSALAGKNVVFKVHNASGSVWQTDCSTLETKKKNQKLFISHSILEADEKQLSMMGCGIGYQIKFSEDAEIDAEILIRLPIENAGRNATLFTVKGKDAAKVQTVFVDSEGYAHFYLASVSKKTVYLIGIDVPGEENNAIIPQNMLAEYGNAEFTEPIKYEITGRTSSWGMNLGQVMSILAVVMVSVIVVVGAVMFFWNRQRLKNGYAPDLDEEET